MIAVILSPIYVMVHIYLIWRILIWMGTCHKFFKKKSVIIIILLIYTFLSTAILVGFLLPQGPLKHFMSGIGNLWLGTLLYTIIIFTIAFFLKLIYFTLSDIPPHKVYKSKVYKISGFISFFFIAVVTIWGAINARNIHTTKYKININKKTNLAELNIVMVADLHLGYNIGYLEIEKMVKKINNEHPDIVIIAGDIFDNNYDALDSPSKIKKAFKRIKSKYGIYAVYGNHDIDEKTLAGFTFDYNAYKVSDLRMDQLLKDSDINLLRDEYVYIDNSFYLYGRPDYQRLGRNISKRKTPQQITKKMDKTKPIIVIDHQPLELQELQKAGVDLDLSGHTHDGQVFPGNILTSLMWDNSYGLKKYQNFTSIVTSGVGVYGPNMRVGTIAEITSIKVKFAN